MPEFMDLDSEEQSGEQYLFLMDVKAKEKEGHRYCEQREQELLRIGTSHQIDERGCASQESGRSS